ncbi:Cna B-type domain-containing protein, partial [Streptococcus oriscaviae]
MKKLKKGLLASLLFLVSLFGAFSLSAEAKAATRDVITEIKVTHMGTQEVLSGPGSTFSIGAWTNMKVDVKFVIPNDGSVKEGDTTTLKLPAEIRYSSAVPALDLVYEGKNFGKLVFDSVNRTATVTYSKNVETMSDIKGSFFVNVAVDHFGNVSAHKIPMTFNVDFGGSGRIINLGELDYVGVPKAAPVTFFKNGYFIDNGQTLRYTVLVNQPMVEMKDVVYYDETDISANFTKLVVRKGNWDYNASNALVMVNGVEQAITPETGVTPDGKKWFRLNIGDIPAGYGYEITYEMPLTYTAENGEPFLNTGKLTYDNGKTLVHNEREIYQQAGATIEGTVFKIELEKVNEQGEPLKGAKFEVYRDISGKKIGEIVTGEDGKGSISNLLRSNYTIKEVEAPTGYQLSSEEIKVTGGEFDSVTKTFTKTVTNKKLISIPVKKVWQDGNNQDGKRPTSVTMKLLANGQEVAGKTIELTEATQWQGSFTDLPQTDAAGQNITYTVTEVAVPGYKLIKTEGDATTGFTITNCHTPEKTKVSFVKEWDDANDQDGIRPITITVVLNANGVEVARKDVQVDQDGNWKGEFTNLDVYKAGVKIDYTVDEVVPTDYTKTITGDASTGFTIKNSHTPVEKKVVFSKINLGGQEIAGAQIQIFKGLTATGTPVAEWTSVEGQSHELNLPVGEYTFHEEAAPNGYVAVTDITFQVNYDGSVTVLDTNSNAVEYKDGK